MYRKSSFCSYCGQAFAADQAWPRTCSQCRRVTYLNPVPVAVTLLPVDGGLLCIRRDIDPGRGKLALPGGFVDVAETWQTACVRELYEETGIVVAADEIRPFAVHSAPGDAVLLVFGLAPARTAADLPPFRPTDETSERMILRRAEEMAFPLHSLVVRELFGGSGPSILRA